MLSVPFPGLTTKGSCLIIIGPKENVPPGRLHGAGLESDSEIFYYNERLIISF